MLDLKLLRDNPDQIREALRRRNSNIDLDALLILEEKRRKQMIIVEANRHQLKKRSDEFRKSKTKGSGGPPSELKELSGQIKEQEQQLREIEEQVTQAVAYIPNIPHESIPTGDATANEVVRSVGKKTTFTFTPKTHVEIGQKLKLFDLERAAKITGSNFPLFIGKGARLERALINWMLDIHTKEHSYTEVSPPYLVNAASMFGTGQLPKFEEDMYHLKDDGLFLVPTAEVPITNLHRDEILIEADLPIRYAAYTPCFRREAGSYGKDTRGLIRVHQFDKVELVKLTTPQNSYDELEKLLGDAELILKRLGLQYRVMLLASRDLGFSAAKCYDLEVWAPGMNQYLEVSSCSNFEDFQARRANLRYRPKDSKKTAFVHTINGSGLALARTVVALLETHQREDGHVVIPEPLRGYLDGAETL